MWEGEEAVQTTIEGGLDKNAGGILRLTVKNETGKFYTPNMSTALQDLLSVLNLLVLI